MGIFGSSRTDDPVELRRRMVERQIESRGVSDPRVLAAMREVPRHLFVGGRSVREAYGDHALSIGQGQTISQPYIVALMTEVLEPEPGLEILEVGTGSGYQAAVLAACGLEVHSVERIPALLDEARRNLEAAGLLDRVRLRAGDGSEGWPERAPFDRILLTAAARELPEPLVEQLAPEGLIVAPVGGPSMQTIYRYRRTPDGELARERIEGARFVPLVRDDGEG